MIQLGKILIFYISFSISWSQREPCQGPAREILLILSEEDGNQLCLGVTLICIRDPIRPSTRACPGRPVVSTSVLASDWLAGLARPPIGQRTEILTVSRDESTNQPWRDCITYTQLWLAPGSSSDHLSASPASVLSALLGDLWDLRLAVTSDLGPTLGLTICT